MERFSPEKIIRPFLLYGGFFFVLARSAVTAGMILLFIHLFVVTAVGVRGESMSPVFSDRNMLIVDQITPRFREISRGEVIVLRSPLDNRTKLVKRVIGLPHETVILKEGRVYIKQPNDDRLLRLLESYVSSPPPLVEKTLSLGAQEYYVLGDNRAVSFDSRNFGAVFQDHILGRVFLVGWPPQEIEFITPAIPILINY